MILAADAFNLAADRRGMGRVVRVTLRALADLDTEVVLIARRQHHGELQNEFANRVVEPGDLRSLKHDAVWYPWNAMRFAPRAPAIVTLHDPFAFTFAHANAVARWREQSPIRRALAGADEIFAVSEWTAAQLRRMFHINASRLRVVPNVPDPFWKPMPAAQQDAYMLFLGGPDARKNSAMLFDAYDAAFTQGGPELIVAGTLREEDERRFERMRAPRRRAHPDDPALRELYSGAMATLVPSLAEGFGLPAIEAMACGSPVLAADAAALPETCGGAALLLPAQDAQAWTHALQRIASDADVRGELRARGLARVRGMDPQGPAKALLESVRRFRAAAR